MASGRTYVGWVVLGVLVLLPGPLFAQRSAPGIDCTKARSPIERSICADPALITLDRETAQAYDDALARAPAERDVLRQEQLRWLRQRNTACALPTPAIPACLRLQLTARIAALALPAANTPPPPTDAAVALPATPVPLPAATLDQTNLPAAQPAETLLHVTAAGRFALSVKSQGGAALQLVDMLTGPSELSGTAGSQDGRIDELLDIGVYKLRVFSAPGASGAVTLTVQPFREAAPPAALPRPGEPFAATLADGEQRAFWLAVPAPDASSGSPSANVRIEAAGRSLADLRLWRNGRELTTLQPETTVVEPVGGHPLNDIRLTGRVAPGTYLAVAYGGPAASWTDNDRSQPFHLRAGLSNALQAGWAGGKIGPFGSETYAISAASTLFRLELPQAARAELLAGDRSAAIARDSREPVARLLLLPGETTTGAIEVRAAEGQAFTLVAHEHPTAQQIRKPGTFWVSAVADGAGGDEVPPTVLLERDDGTGAPARIIASSLPTIGPKTGWRARFNLHGATTLLAHSLGGPAEFRSTGVPLRGGQINDNLPKGYFAYEVMPQNGALGAVEVTLGAPGLTPPLADALPRDPVLPFGIQTLGPRDELRLTGNTAPGFTLGLSARPVPVVLAEGPLSVSLPALAGADVPVAITPGGTLAVSEVGHGPSPYTTRPLPGQTKGETLVSLPPADHARTVVLAWRQAVPPATAIPAPRPRDAQTDITAGTPMFFDLQRQQSVSVDLSVPTGGLYRIETTGRLRTAGRLGTAFLPEIATADANGIGQNMLLQTMLRAGRYHVTVTAEDSAGHAGLSATPATLLATAPLQPGGTVRAHLPAGTGALLPVEVATDAMLHFDVLGLGSPWRGRLENSEGWPITRPGPLDGTELQMPPGHNRLLIEPASTDRDLVVRLRATERPAAIIGHGPHPLPFGSTQTALWREPDSQTAPRTPDRWNFMLEGSAAVVLRLGDAMVGELRGSGSEPVRRVAGRWKGILGPGRYELDVSSLGRNDRAEYTVALDSAELQPNTPRRVTLPATVPFTIAEPRVVTLTSFGTVPVRATLRDANRQVIGRYGPRADDWNIAVSHPLPQGAYSLELARASAPDAARTALRDAPAGIGGDNVSDDAGGDADQQAAQTVASQTADDRSPASPDPAPASVDDDTPASSSDDDVSAPAAGNEIQAPPVGEDSTARPPTVEIRLALPPALDQIPASDTVAVLDGQGVHMLSLPAPASDHLLMVQAQAASALVLSLERQAGSEWQVVALDQGRAPVVAAPGPAEPGGGDASAWRVRTWLVDGGSDPVRAVARLITAPAQRPGTIALAPLDAVAAPLAVARVSLPAGLASTHTAADVRSGSWPGHGLTPALGDTLPVAGNLWLLGTAGAAQVEPLSPAQGQTVALTLPAGFTATLPTGSPTELWLARAGTGQPSLGAATGWARGSAIALAGSPVALLGDAGPFRVDLRRVGLTLAPAIAVDTAGHTVLPAGGAVPVTLPPGAKRLNLTLAAGTGAVPGWHDPREALWAGDAVTSRSLTGNWTELLLVNPGSADAPVTLAIAPTPDRDLGPGDIETRFFAAAGSFEMAVRGAADGRLRLSGPGRLTLIDASGRIASGTDLALTGPGRAIVEHTPGAVALWVEAPGASPWPDLTPKPLATPARTGLSGTGAAFELHADTPALLHVSSTAPAFLRIGSSQPTPYQTGIELDRVLVSSATTLRLYPLQDGPLTGTLTVRSAPIQPVGEGLGPEIVVSPGGAAAFGFTLDHAATIGVGLRADPNRISARLLDGTGRTVGTGIAQLVSLQPGRYILEAQVPLDAPATTLRAAIVGLAVRGNGPPPDVVRDYLELAGMKPQGPQQ